MQNSQAVDVIEASWRERQFENVGLEERRLSVSEIFFCHFASQAQINAHYMRAPPGCDFGKPPHPATHIEHEFTREILRLESSAPPEILFRAPAGFIVKLRPPEQMPLKS